MLLGIISDSHDNLYALKKVLLKLLEQKIDLVIHLGDIISPFTVKLMKEILKDIKVLAVKGNNDGDVYQLATLFSQYNWVFRSEPGVVEINNRKILVLHGYSGIKDTEKLVNAWARSLDVDIVLYGHTHQYVLDNVEGRLVLNPGEVCGYLTDKVSYAIIDLKTLKAEINFLEGW